MAGIRCSRCVAVARYQYLPITVAKTIPCCINMLFLIIWYIAQVLPLVNLQNCPSDMIELMKLAIPPLDGETKGDSGRIGIIGGSIEYTGAPYFAAMSSLKVGSDLVYVITTESAAPIIKSYSPDLIVYPFLDMVHLNKAKSLIPKMDVIVIGPGLGRTSEAVQLTYEIINSCRDLKKPVVIDADGLYAVSKNIKILNAYPSPGVILTPNHREEGFLQEAMKNQTSTWGDYVTILVKGESDKYYLSDLDTLKWTLTVGGSGRRTAGQGDILSGILGTFFNWALKPNYSNCGEDVPTPNSIATYSAAKLTRLCNAIGFTKYGRSMTATDMLKQIHHAFDDLFTVL